MEEAELWRRFLNADQKAFESLFSMFYKPLYSYGFKTVRNRQLLDDCIQDLFFELWTRRETLEDVKSVKGYLLKALKYKLVRELKKEIRFHEIDHETDTWFEYSHETMLIEQQANSDQKNRLTHYLKNLTKRQQEAIYLRFYSQLSYEEIAEIMSLSYQAVVNLVYKSVKYLREHLVPMLVCIFSLNVVTV